MSSWLRSRFIADSREGVLQQGGEFLRAKAAGLVSDAHIVAEIGQVLMGEVEGRRSAEEITVYKSLGHIVQDLASAAALYSRPRAGRRARGFDEYCRMRAESRMLVAYGYPTSLEVSVSSASTGQGFCSMVRLVNSEYE